MTDPTRGGELRRGVEYGPPYDRRRIVRTDDDVRLDVLREAGILRDVDMHFARTTARITGEHRSPVVLGMAMASRAPGVGHVCVELDAPDRLVRREDEAAPLAWPDAASWRAALLLSDVVTTPAAEDPARPLVLDGNRIYLARYWRYQKRLIDALSQRAGVVHDDVDDALLRGGLDRLFPRRPDAAEPDLQRVAACVAVLRALTVITGGPGTGKTTTVVRVLALLVEQALERGEEPPRIALAAPTGKAAARMAESIASGLAQLDVSSDVREAIVPKASTIHRLLGWQPRTPTRFRHDATKPLGADIVVVDEASMVDLALMAKLVDAVPADARLVLLGDRDQLASVEAGSILSDVCGDATNAFSPAFAARVSAITGDVAVASSADNHFTQPAIADAVVRLARSHRFRDDGGIGALARAINAGDADGALATLGSGDAETTFVSFDGGYGSAGSRGRASAIARDVVQRAVKRYRTMVRAEGPEAALAALEQFRVLTPHRRGPLGVAGLNDAIVAALAAEGTLPRNARADRWFAGQPVLVTENDPGLNLFNGDVGVVLADIDRTLRVYFRDPDGIRTLSPARLPAHETVFAMTVHKAQGSEFDEVLVALPAEPSRVLTRELLYTAVSRARRHVTVVAVPDVLRAGIAERVQRASGLREALWG